MRVLVFLKQEKIYFAFVIVILIPIHTYLSPLPKNPKYSTDK